VPLPLPLLLALCLLLSDEFSLTSASSHALWYLKFTFLGPLPPAIFVQSPAIRKTNMTYYYMY
jgi:hypothetical protein